MRTRLAAGLAILFIAVFGLIAYSHFQYLNDKRDARLEDMQRVSQTVAAAFDGLTHDLESFSLSTAITLGDANLTIDESASEQTQTSVNDYLRHLFESHGLLRAIFVTDTKGTVIFDNDGNSFGRDLSDRAYIQALQAGASDFWSDGFEGSDTGQMVIAHSRAIVNPEGATTGYFIVALRTQELAERLPAGLVDEGHISIIDGSGTLVLRMPGDDSGMPVGTSLAAWPALASSRNDGGTLINDQPIPLDGDDRYGALVRMENLGWTVGYTLPESAVEGSTTGVLLRDLAVLGAIVLVAFGAMWVFASQTVRPLTRLTAIASSIARGDTHADPGTVDSGNAEVSMLANAMAQMQQSIRDREGQLQVQANVIEAIEHFGEALASELDFERAVQSILDAGIELVSAEAVQFVQRNPAALGAPVAVTGPIPSLALPGNAGLVQDVLGGKTVEIGDLQAESVAAARSLLGVPVRDQSGAIEGALILLHSRPDAFNGAQRRLAEGLARWACIVLENARLYARSQKLIADLAESNEAKNDFLGIVSHELRTPITTIYGGTLLLRLRRESLPEQAFTDMIVSISEEAERLHHLVQDLLMIARTELVIEPRPVSVPEVVQTVVGEFSSTHKRPVRVDIEAGLPEAMADATYVRQVLTNLVSNADKYTPSERPIEIVVAERNAEIVVRVLDNGDGIDEEDQAHIFESFYRSRTAAERASGSGLGLTVCRRLIESLGGRIWATNRPDGGLEVGFTLKRVASESKDAAANGANGIEHVATLPARAPNAALDTTEVS